MLKKIQEYIYILIQRNIYFLFFFIEILCLSISGVVGLPDINTEVPERNHG